MLTTGFVLSCLRRQPLILSKTSGVQVEVEEFTF